MRLPKQQRGVVLHRYVPEVGAKQRRMQRQGPGEPVGEIEQMHALVDQLAASRPLRLANAIPPRIRADRRDRTGRADA